MNDPSAEATPRRESEVQVGDVFEFATYRRLVMAYKWVILATVLVTGTAVVFWTLRQPPVYESTCTIEYDPNPTSPLGHEVEDVSNPVGGFFMSREFFSTQNEIIASRTVAERVVRTLGLNDDPDYFAVPEAERSSWAGASIEDAAMRLQLQLSVEQQPETRLVRISIQDTDRERAATLANAIADAYIEKTMEDRLGSTVNALEWLGSQLDTLRTQLDESELALHRFKEEHNVLSVSMEDRQNLVAGDIQAYNTALTKTRTSSIQLQARLQRIRHILEEEDPEVSAAAFPEHTTLTSLRSQLRERLAERQGLSTRYGPQHQRMQQLDGEIVDLRTHLTAELAGVENAAAADVREIRQVESGLRRELDTANHAGLQLNLREIEYRRLNRQRENNSKLYNLVLERSAETDLTRMMRRTHVRLVDRALAPLRAVSPNLPLNTVVGLVAGIVFGLFFAFVLSGLDRRIKSVSDVESLGVNVLGILPKVDRDGRSGAYSSKGSDRRRSPPTPVKSPGESELFVHTHPMSAAAECCRTIRTNLTFMGAGEPIRALLITSASPREGKTTVSTNIATSLAQSGKRVLIIDTDLRRPRVHKAIGVSGQHGVTSIIVEDAALADVVVPTEIPNLDVLPSGPVPPNPSELLHSARFDELVQEALQAYDRVIFDSSPLGAVTDAAIIAPQMDAVLIVVKSAETTRDALRSVLRQLHDVRANIAGSVLNEVDLRQARYGNDDHYYYYYRRQRYYYAEDGESSEDGSDDDATPPSLDAAAG